MQKTETIWRVTYHRVDGGENYAAYHDEQKAVRCLVKRLGWGVHTGAVLEQWERTSTPKQPWGNERLIATRRFDATGREMPSKLRE